MKKIISLLALALFLAMYVPVNAQNDGFFSSSYIITLTMKILSNSDR